MPVAQLKQVKASLADHRFETFSLHLTNVSPRDARWLGQICALFCDPQNADTLRRLKGGTLTLGYAPIDGTVRELPVISPN